MKNRRGLHGTMLAAAALMMAVTVTAASAADFNWRKHEGTTIRVMIGKSAFTPVNEKFIAAFEEKTGIKVQAEHYPSAQLRQKALMELAGGNKDLEVYQDLMKTAFQFERAGWTEPLDKYIKDPQLTAPDFDYEDFFERVRPIIRGKTAGIASSANPQVLIYRKDLFEKHGVKVPTNWKELEAAAKKLTLDEDGDGKTDIYGWIARMDDENSAPFSCFLHNNGAAWLDKDRNPVFNSPKAVEAFSLYGRLAKSYGPPGASTLGWKEVVGAMAQGRAAMTLEISIFAKMILENPKQSKVVGKLGYAEFPANTGAEPRIMLPLNMTFMSALSQKKEAAWFYLQFMNSKESHLTFQMLGLPSCRKSSWESPVFKEKDTLPLLSKIQYHGMQTGMIGYELPVAGFQEARPLIERTIYTAYEGGDVQKAADEAVKGVKEIMDKTEK